MASLEPLEKYQTLLSSSNFLFIVNYRGHWCPFCTSYVSTLQSLSPSISSSGGKTVVITSEPSSLLPLTRKYSNYDGEAIVDPDNKLVQYFREKGMVEVAISEMRLSTGLRNYEFGMAQPAILVVAREGEEVLERWAIVPGLMNIGGEKDRPDLGQVWENVQAKLDDKERVNDEYKTIGVWDVIKGAIFG